MQYTNNYKFRLPDQNDEFNIDDFNENSKSFDSTLKEAVTKFENIGTSLFPGLKTYVYDTHTFSLTLGENELFELDGYKDCSIAAGDRNKISYCSLAVGMNNNGRNQSLAVGYGNIAGVNTAAIGNENQAGNSSIVSGTENVIINFSGAIGQKNTTSNYSLAVGSTNKIYTSSAAIGNTNNGGNYNLLVGENNIANYTKDDGTVLGYNQCTLVGLNNNANGLNATAFGSGNNCGMVGIVAGQNNTSFAYSAAFGEGNNLAGAYSFAVGKTNTSTLNNTVAIGTNNTLTNSYEYVLGDENATSGMYNLVIGSTNTTTKGTGANNVTTFILGSGNTVKANKYGYCNFVIGANNNLFGNSNFAFGTGNTIGKDDSNSTNNCSSVVFGSSNKVALLTNHGGNALVKGDLNETGGMSVIGKNNKLAYALGGLAIGDNHSTNSESSGYLGKSMLMGDYLQLNTSDTANLQSNDYTQHTLIVGRYNNSAKQGFITVGNGTSSARSNVFRVANDGTTYLKTTQTSGADYAEMFEYEDGNEAGEDRRGLIVAIDGEKIKVADAETYIDDIIGIVSATPSVIGDAQGENWSEKYLKDAFGQTIYEDVEIPEHTETRPTYDELGNVTGEEDIVIEAKVERQPKLNPNFDATKEYVAREDRKEWDAVGLVGKLIVITDGTVKVNKYVRPADGGIATLSSEKTNMRVMKIIDDTHALVLVK